MDATETPDATEEWLRFGCGVIFVEPTAPATRIDFTFDGRTQEIEHARDGDEESGAFALDGAENFGRISGGFENYRGAEERGNEEGHELSEDVAERNQGDEAERMKKAFVFEVGLHAALDGFEVGEKVSMGEDDAAGFGSGAGGEQDFCDVVTGDWFAGDRFVERLGCFTGNSPRGEDAMLRCYVGQILQYQGRNGWIERRLVTGGDDQFDLRIASDARGKIARSGIVHRHGDGTEEEAAPEGGEPFGRVRSPEEDAVAGLNVAGLEGVCEEQSEGGEAFVAPGRVTITSRVDNGAIALEAFEIGEEGEE